MQAQVKRICGSVSSSVRGGVCFVTSEVRSSPAATKMPCPGSSTAEPVTKLSTWKTDTQAGAKDGREACECCGRGGTGRGGGRVKGGWRGGRCGLTATGGEKQRNIEHTVIGTPRVFVITRRHDCSLPFCLQTLPACPSRHYR